MQRLLKISVLLPLCAVAISPLLAASWLDRPPLPDQLLSSRRNIHQAVLALEREPLHENAALIRAFVLGHFKKVDYLICGDVLGPLTEAKTLEPVMFQIVIGWATGSKNTRDVPGTFLRIRSRDSKAECGLTRTFAPPSPA